MWCFYTSFGVATLGLIAGTCWMGYWRYAQRLDSNWPLFYYLGVVAYFLRFDPILEPRMVYGGLVSALLLRFEFMGGPIQSLVRILEGAFLGYILWRASDALSVWRGLRF